MIRIISQVLLISGLLGYCFSALRQYYYVGKSMNWFEAQGYCRAWYTDLATLNSINEVANASNVIDPTYNGSVWIGLKRGTQSQWGWSAGNYTLAQYTNWAPAEPTVTPCGILTRFAVGWATHDCSHIHRFLCFNATATNSSRWILVKLEHTWKEAQTLCRKNYTDLAIIRHLEDERQVASVVLDEAYVWIGLFSDYWEWSGLNKNTFRYWADSEPGNTDGCTSLAVYDHARWYDEDCYLRKSFICFGEKKIVKKRLLRLKVSFDGNSEDSAFLLDAIVKQIMDKSRIRNVTELVWKEKNGSVLRPVQAPMTQEKCQ